MIKLQLLLMTLLLLACKAQTPSNETTEAVVSGQQVDLRSLGLSLAESRICSEYGLLDNDVNDTFQDSPGVPWLTPEFVDKSNVLVGYEALSSFEQAREICHQVSPYLVKKTTLDLKEAELFELKENASNDAEMRQFLVQEVDKLLGWIEVASNFYNEWESILLQMGLLGRPETLRRIVDANNETLAVAQLNLDKGACEIESFVVVPALHWPSATPQPNIEAACKDVSDPTRAGLVHIARELKEIHNCTQISIAPTSTKTPLSDLREMLKSGVIENYSDLTIPDAKLRLNVDKLLASVRGNQGLGCRKIDWGNFGKQPMAFAQAFDTIATIPPHSEK